MKLQSEISRSIAFVFILSVAASKVTGQPGLLKNDLFESNDLLTITLKGSTRDLLNNRYGESKKFPFTLSFINEDNATVTMPVDVKTRGHFRRMSENCSYPPLLIEFSKDSRHLSTIFKEQVKLKLVMPCRGDEYIIREWLVYKLYNLITPFSFRARLVKVDLEDSNNKKKYTPLTGLLLEEEDQMAKRNKATAVEAKIAPQQTRVNEFLTMAVFQYLIGNTDWSVQYLQNIKLLIDDTNSLPVTVAYDFDHAGLINAPYAKPEEALQMNSIRQRRYRGYCIANLSVFNNIISKFNDLKDKIYKLYTGCSLLDAKYIKSTIQYLDEFYATINNTKAWQKAFAYPCDKNGTGNVVIKGLKED